MTSFRFKLDQIQFSYEADFFPPILEIASSANQVSFMKRLLTDFALKLGDVVLSPQNLSRNLVSFRRWAPNNGWYDVTLGTDGFSLNYLNPVSLESAWEPALKTMKTIGESTKFTFERQVLKFQGHCSHETVNASEFIAKYNTFATSPELLTAKGLTFMFSGPTANAQTFLVLNESALIADGLYVFSEITFLEPSDRLLNVFGNSVDFLRDVVFRALELEITIGA